jgi:hypothetical protein
MQERAYMTAERQVAFDIVDAIMREREGGQLRSRREWERFVEDAIEGALFEVSNATECRPRDWAAG